MSYRNPCDYGLGEPAEGNDYGQDDDYLDSGCPEGGPLGDLGEDEHVGSETGETVPLATNLGSEDDDFYDGGGQEDAEMGARETNVMRDRTRLNMIEMELINRLNCSDTELKRRESDTLTYRHLGCFASHTLHDSLLEMESSPEHLEKLRSRKGLVSCSANTSVHMFTEMYRFNAPVGQNTVCYGGQGKDMRRVTVTAMAISKAAARAMSPGDAPGEILRVMSQHSCAALRWLPNSCAPSAHYDPLPIGGDRSSLRRKDMFLVAANGLVSSALSRTRPFLSIDGDERERVCLTLQQSFSGAGLSHGMRNNQSLYLYPKVPQFSIEVEDKSYRPEFTGFLDPVTISMGASGGCNRQICPDVEVRLWSTDTYLSMMVVMLTMVGHLNECERARTHKVVLDSCSYDCCSCSIVSMLEGLRGAKQSKNNCTLHYFDDRRTLRVSYCPGALMRRCPLGYVDNIMANGDFVMFSGPVVFDARTRLIRALSWCPFHQLMPCARTSLTEGFLTQAVCHPFSNLVGTIVPHYHQWPLCVTKDLSSVILRCLREGIDKSPLPGLNVRVAFVNAGYGTYEDGMVMSESCAKRFAYSKVTAVVISAANGCHLVAGDVIEPHSRYYWALPVPGKVLSVVIDSDNRAHVRIERSQHAVSGDKFTTMHGQKSVVTVLPDSEMVRLSKIGEVDVLMGLSSLVKRGTLSQLLEAVYSQRFVDDLESVGTTHSTEHFICPDTEEMQSIDFQQRSTELMSDYESEFTYGQGDHVSHWTQCFGRESNYVSEASMCNYGIIRLMQSPFMTNDKLQYTRVESTKFTRTSLRGKQAGGSVTLGEMEIQQMLGNGLTNVLKEFTLRSDAVTVYVCNACRCLQFLCDCDPEGKAVEDRGHSVSDCSLVTTRHSTVSFALMMYQKDSVSMEFR